MRTMSEATEKRKAEQQGPVFSAEQARQGEIILRTRRRRIIFIAGLVGIVVLAFLLQFAVS
jgi:hypothetical protein